MKSQESFTRELVDVVNAHLPEIEGRATPTASFEDLDIDSLTCVELSVLLGRRYEVDLAEVEVAEAGDFATLALVVRGRLPGGAT